MIPIGILAGQKFAPAFDPVSLGAIFALDALAITGLSDGATLATWTGLPGTSINGSTVSNSPIYKASILNGGPVVRFDGVSAQMVSSANLALSQPYTVYAVVIPRSNPGRYCSFADSSNGNALLFSGATGNTTLAMFAGSEVDHPTTIALGTAYVVVGVFNGASSIMSLNGVTASGNPGTGGYQSVRLGTNFIENAFYQEDYGAVGVIPSALTPTQRQGLEAYLGARFGIAV